MAALHSYLSILDQLGAQPWQDPAREGALDVPGGDCSCLCLRQHCRVQAPEGVGGAMPDALQNKILQTKSRTWKLSLHFGTVYSHPKKGHTKKASDTPFKSFDVRWSWHLMECPTFFLCDPFACQKQLRLHLWQLVKSHGSSSLFRKAPPTDSCPRPSAQAGHERPLVAARINSCHCSPQAKAQS